MSFRENIERIAVGNDVDPKAALVGARSAVLGVMLEISVLDVPDLAFLRLSILNRLRELGRELERP